MVIFYNIIIHFYFTIIVVAGLFNKKARLFLAGRKNIFFDIQSKIKSTDTIAWFHAASLGEFEQGRSVIEAFRKRHPEFKILLTFFSPSGYEFRKNYQGADFIFYLPFDFKKNAEKFISIVRPEIVFFIKYEYWYNYLNTLKKSGIPVYVFSSIFREDQIFFKWYGGLFRKLLSFFHHLFVQDERSKSLLLTIGINNVTVAGDTRFDRVAEIAEVSKDISIVKQFAGDNLIIIAGSSWQPDETILVDYINSQDEQKAVKFIIAPHEIKPGNINRIMQCCNKKTIKFSEALSVDITGYKVLIIDNIGMLSSLYKYAHIAFIGGGFGKGIHNTLEAAVFGCPLLFGPKYQKFREAHDLIDRKAAIVIHNYSDFKIACDSLYKDREQLETTALAAKNYVKSCMGGTNLILDFVDKVIKK